MNKNTLKYLTFLSGSFSILSGTGGVLASENWVQILTFGLMLILAIVGAVFYLRFKRYHNGSDYLQECVNAIKQPGKEWSFHAIQNEAELRSIWKISQEIYREDNVDFQTVLSWWKCYPSGVFILYKDANIVGYFSMWPIKASTYKQIIGGRRRERELKRQSIMGKDATEPRAYWYITNIVVQKAFRKSTAAKVLLSEALRKWVNDGNLAQDIHLCAFGYSKEGTALIKNFGFHELKDSMETADHLPLYIFTSTCENINALVGRLSPDTVAEAC